MGISQSKSSNKKSSRCSVDGTEETTSAAGSSNSSCCVLAPFKALRTQYREKKAGKRQVASFGNHPWMTKEMYEVPDRGGVGTHSSVTPTTATGSSTSAIGSGYIYSKKTFLELRSIDLDAIKRVKLTPQQQRQEEDRLRRMTRRRVDSIGTSHSRTSSLGDETSLNGSKPNTPLANSSLASTPTNSATPSSQQFASSRRGSFSRLESYRLDDLDAQPPSLYRFHCSLCDVILFDDEEVRIHITQSEKHCIRRSLVQERRSLAYIPEYNFILRQKLPFELTHQVLAFLLSKPPVPFFKHMSNTRPCGHGWCTLPHSVNCCICLDKRRYELGHNNASVLQARKAAGATTNKKKARIKYCPECVENQQRWEKAMKSRAAATKRKQDEGAAKVIEKLKDHFEDLEGFRF